MALRGKPPEVVAAEVMSQIEYYFSVKNICQDSYLRSRMDNDGWVKLKEITRFPKLRALSVDVAACAKVLRNSTSVEISEDGKRARIMNGVIRQLFPREQNTAYTQRAPAHDQHGAQRRRGAGAPRARAARNKRRSG
jgi:la-related protein 1